MAALKELLFPIDLAEDTERPLRYARALAHQLGARLHLLYVVQEFDFARGIFIPHANIDKLEEDYRVAAQRKMERLREDHFEGDPDVVCAVAFGDPAEEILGYAERAGIGVIALPTHGRTGLEHALFGSVAEKVVKISHVPVLTIRPENL